ncbi:MAG: hypothetical protein N2203_07300 [Bacteroidia bacterium]|nr:hypothetical protein [Bacteroidia bacterium]
MQTYTEIKINEIWSDKELPNNTKDKNFLLLTELHKSPPHCSLLYQNLWFTLNYYECKTNIPASALFKILNSKSASAIFLELDVVFELKVVQDIFSKYSIIQFEKGITCISPIKDVFIYYDIPVSKNDLLYEMLEGLLKNNYIKKSYALNYQFNSYKISHYSLNTLFTNANKC